MRTRLSPVILAAGLLGGVAFDSAMPNVLAHSPDAGSQLLLQCAPTTTHAQALAWCTAEGLQLRSSRSNQHGLEIITLQAHQTAADTIARAEASGLFEYAEPDYPIYSRLLPNDRGLVAGQTWGLVNVGQRRGVADADVDAPEAWDLRTSASDIIVAVIDSGIRYTHEDLAGNMWRNPGEIPDNGRDDDRNGVIDDVFGYNAVDFSGDPWDDDGHGTSVSGVIGAVGDNRLGTTGVAWQVQLMALKFLTSSGAGLTSDAIECIDYALEHGADVINASWGGNGRSRSLERAIRRAQFQDVLFVTAAGNDGLDIDIEPDYPASYNLANVITVGASTRTDRASTLSNFGNRTVDLFAPGTEIYTSFSGTDSSYGFTSGTSLAAPFVTGALALMMAADQTLSGAELTEHLLSSVDPLPMLTELSISGGRLNVATALGQIVPAAVQMTPPQLSLQITDQRGSLLLNASPNQAYLLESSSDLDTWRPLARIETDETGRYEGSNLETDANQGFYRVRPLN